LPIIFSSGIDIRIFNQDQATFINKYVKIIRHHVIHFAWDNPLDNMIPHIKELLKYILPYKLSCYVLIGFNSSPDQDLMRVKTLWNFKIAPFVMPYNKFDPYQNRFARWCNCKPIFTSIEWKNYK